jgi:hypothetical protein
LVQREVLSSFELTALLVLCYVFWVKQGQVTLQLILILEDLKPPFVLFWDIFKDLKGSNPRNP